MSIKTSAWAKQVRAAVRKFADTGLTEAPAAPQFDFCEHICVEAAGLAGYAVIHQRDPKDPFGFCVFEPNATAEHGVDEVFERTMTSLDELPRRIAEWRAFRESTDTFGSSSTNEDHLSWLRAVATDKKKTFEQLNESRLHRLAGDTSRAWETAGFVVKVPSSLSKDVPPEAAECLLEDFDSIAPDLLAWHLDRDDVGKPFLKRRVPLFRYDRDPRKHHTYCLVVALPEKRSGQPEIRAEWLDANAQTVRLDATPELFDTRLAEHFTKVLLGAEATRVRTWCEPNSKSRAGLMATLGDQFAGKFQEAAARANIELDPSVTDCLRSRRVTHMCTCCAPLDEQLKAWSAVLRRALLEANLTNLAPLLYRDLERTKRSLRNEPIPILPFPMQRHIRKAHLAVARPKSGNPRLCIETTGSGIRVPLSVWRRPVDFDLLRAGFLTPEDLPTSVAEQWGLKSQTRRTRLPT